MVTYLGWRDKGQVLLTALESNRRELDQRRGEDGRDAPIFCGATLSKRVHREKKVDVERERDIEEAAKFQTDPGEVFRKRTELRLKWLQQALIHAAKNRLKVVVIFDIVSNRHFTAGVEPRVGSRMKALLIANLHLFTGKQQKWIQSDTGSFGPFEAGQAPQMGGADSADGGQQPLGKDQSESPEPIRKRPRRSVSRSAEPDRRDQERSVQGSMSTAGPYQQTEISNLKAQNEALLRQIQTQPLYNPEEPVLNEPAVQRAPAPAHPLLAAVQSQRRSPSPVQTRAPPRPRVLLGELPKDRRLYAPGAADEIELD